jgi:hypothetical protein
VIEFDISSGKSGAEKTYKAQEKEVMIVPVGRKIAVGVIYGLWLPSFCGWLLKGRNFMADRANSVVLGEKWAKKQTA